MRRPSRHCLILPVCLSLLALAAPAWAQTDAGAPETARFQFGPLGLQPRFRLTDVGIDTNILNASSNPQRDFTATFVPEVDSFVRVGRAAFTGKTSLDLVYFRTDAQQRSVDLSQDGRLTFQLTHFTPFVGGGYVTSNQRPNDEIDARVHRTVTSAGAGVSMRLAPKLSLDVSGAQNQFAFADVTFDGVNLAQVLDRTSRGVTARLAAELTPLTTFVAQTVVAEDRFPASPDRNANSTTVTAGFDLKRSALLSGNATVGVKWFRPSDPALQAYTGPVADVTLSYLMRDRTQFTTRVARDTDYSFEVDQPFFVTTTVGLTVTQLLVGRVDAVCRLVASQFDYHSFVAAAGALPLPARNDQLTSVGTGAGYRLSTGARIGFDVSYVRRTSPVADRSYRGFRFGGSFIYGY